MVVLKTILRFFWAFWALVVFLIMLLLMTPLYFSIFFIMGEKGSPFAHKVSTIWARLLLTLFAIRVKVHNQDRLDYDQTYVFISNHASQLDIPTWAIATQHFFKFLAKVELTKIPLLGYIIKHLYLTVDRYNAKARAESKQKMKESLMNGTSVVIFPEGTRNRTEESVRPFFNGAFQLGVDSGYTIAVLTIVGSWDLLPADSLFQLKPGTIHCYWEGVMPTEGLSEQDISVIREEAKRWMEERIAGKSEKVYKDSETQTQSV